MDAYHRPGHWPTWDGVVPWATFYVMLKAMMAVRMQERLERSYSSTQATAGFGGEEGVKAAEETARKWHREGYGVEPGD